MRKNPITWKGVGYTPRGDTTGALDILTKRLDATVGGLKKSYDEQRAVNTSNLIASLYDPNGANVAPPKNGNFDIGAVLQASIGKENAEYNREKDISVTQSGLNKDTSIINKNTKQATGYDLDNQLKELYGAESTEAEINYSNALTDKAKKDKGTDTELTQARINLLKAQTDKAKKVPYQEKVYKDKLEGTLLSASATNLASNGKIEDVPITDKERVKIGIANKTIKSKEDYIARLVTIAKENNPITLESGDDYHQSKAEQNHVLSRIRKNADKSYNDYVRKTLQDSNINIPTTKKVRKPYTTSEIKGILKPDTVNKLLGVMEGVNKYEKDKTYLELKALKKTLASKKASDKEVKKMKKLSVDLLRLAEGNEGKYNDFLHILNGSKKGDK